MGVMKKLYGQRRELLEAIEAIPPSNPWQSKMKAFLLDEIDACFKLDGTIDSEPIVEVIQRSAWLADRLVSLQQLAEDIAIGG